MAHDLQATVGKIQAVIATMEEVGRDLEAALDKAQRKLELLGTGQEIPITAPGRNRSRGRAGNGSGAAPSAPEAMPAPPAGSAPP